MDAKAMLERFEVLAEAPGGVARVRQLVLELAVRGRLVPQEAGDEPASALLARIAKERARLVAEKKVAKSDPLPPVGEGERSYELPEGWAWARLGDLCSHVVDCLHATPQHVPSGMPSIRTADLVPGRLLKDRVLRVSQETYLERVERLVPEAGDIVYNREGGRFGIAARIPEGYRCCLGQRMMLMRMLRSAMSHYVMWAINSDVVVNQARAGVGGSASPHVNISSIRRFAIPMPPIGEQTRIAETIESMRGWCDQLEQRLADRDARREGMRDLVLGKIAQAPVAEARGVWTRAAASWPTLVQRVEDLELLRKTFLDASLYRGAVDYRQTASRPEAYSLPTLRAGWAWQPIADLGHTGSEPIQTGPFGSKLLASNFVAVGVPVIAVGNLGWNTFAEEGLYFVSREKARELERYDVQAGDILFARSGATLGKVCIAPPHVKDWRMTGHIMRVRLDARKLLPELAVLFLCYATAVLDQVFGRVRGATRPGFNTQLLGSVKLPVPPAGRQVELLAEVRDFMALCDRLEASLRAQRAGHEAVAAAFARALAGASSAA